MFELLRLAFVVFHWSFGSTTSNSKKQQTRSRFKPLNLRNRPNCLCFLTQNLLSLLCSLDKKVFRQRTFFFLLERICWGFCCWWKREGRQWQMWGRGEVCTQGKLKERRRFHVWVVHLIFNHLFYLYQHPVLEIKQRALHQVDNIWDWVLGWVVGKLTWSFFRYEPNTESRM